MSNGSHGNSRRHESRKQLLLLQTILLMTAASVAIGNVLSVESAEVRVVPVAVPPCERCTMPQPVQYSDPAPDVGVSLGWYETYSCEGSCID